MAEISAKHAKNKIRKQQLKDAKQKQKDATSLKINELKLDTKYKSKAIKAQKKLDKLANDGKIKSGKESKESTKGKDRKLKDMSDDDLSKAINRLNKDKQYNQLVKEMTPKTKGEQILDVGKTVGSKLGNKLIEKGTEEAANRIMGYAKSKLPNGAAQVVDAVNKNSGGTVKEKVKQNLLSKIAATPMEMTKANNDYRLQVRKMKSEEKKANFERSQQKAKTREASAESRHKRTKDLIDAAASKVAERDQRKRSYQVEDRKQHEFDRKMDVKQAKAENRKPFINIDRGNRVNVNAKASNKSGAGAVDKVFAGIAKRSMKKKVSNLFAGARQTATEDTPTAPTIIPAFRKRRR